ncbi:hypothetical protein SDC9_193012 [bioreactor metagenome]|uniref:Uncharacterized protein n=1 Tax=bioreactor metagenome TaxID=1076179 RepID=A0A645I2E4_9ZZZZ
MDILAVKRSDETAAEFFDDGHFDLIALGFIVLDGVNPLLALVFGQIFDPDHQIVKSDARTVHIAAQLFEEIKKLRFARQQQVQQVKTHIFLQAE